MNDDLDRALVRAHLAHLKRTNTRPETRRQREAHLRRLVEVLETPLAQISGEQLDAWQVGLAARGLAAASQRAYASHVRAFYAWAVAYGRLEENPAADLVAPKVPPGRPRPIPEDKLRIAIAAASEPVRTWLVLAGWCGLRGGEISRITRQDIGEELLTVDGKGGRARVVWLPAEVRALLVAHVKGAGPVFHRADGRPVAPHTVSSRCNEHLRDVGAGCTLHQLRHRFGTRLYAVTSDLRLVQDALGHSSPAITAVYVASDARRGRRGFEKLAKELSRPNWASPRTSAGDAA